MNDRKFCFIICVNNELYFNECVSYLQRIEVPEGYETELITCDDEESIAASYNSAMKSSDAKYKIYIHQDTFIVNEHILFDLLDIFEDDKVAAVGVMGGDKITSNLYSAMGEVWGRVITQNNFDKTVSLADKSEDKDEKETEKTVKLDSPKEEKKNTTKEVGVLWGCMVATSKDFEWEEIWNDDKKFYSYIHSLTVRENNFKNVVPITDTPWCIHDGNNAGYGIKKSEIKKFKDRFGSLIEDSLSKRILFCNSKEVIYPTILFSLVRMGYEADIYFEKHSCIYYNEEKMLRIEEWLESNDYECIITFEYMASVAVAAEAKKIKYLSWAWDSPLLQYYDSIAKSDTTYAFMFDKSEVEILKKYGLPHVYHLPLVTDVYTASGLVIEPADEKKYSHDVSFVGQMYETKMMDDPEKYFGPMAEQAKEVFENHICNWHDGETVNSFMTDEIIQSFVKAQNIPRDKEYREAYFKCMVYRNVAYNERLRILNALGEHFKVDLYTKGKTSELRNINIHEPVNSMYVAPKIFHLSKINLNITIHAIQTGAPLRVFDIMGVGGFVMSNYQEELAELFVPDKEIVLFKDIDELIEKTDYYLKHEEARLRIAMNGYQRVRKDYTYDVALKKMFKMAEMDSLLQ